jgi:hypothetical protein
MHAEKIKYESGLQIELLIKNTTVTNHRYNLVFLARKEDNDNSYIVTAFDKYRIHLAAPPRPEKIQGYLLRHLKGDVQADPNQCRLRIVKSQQSGNGKSLVARRLSERVLNCQRRTLQLHDNDVAFDKIISVWMEQMNKSHIDVFHLDLTPAIRSGRSDLIFSLSVLGGLVDPAGQIWLTPKNVFVIVELTVSKQTSKQVILKIKTYFACFLF